MEKRWIRKCRAASYLDMGNTLFNKAIRPLLPPPFVVGDVSLFYERSELDRAADEYLKRSGQSSRKVKVAADDESAQVSDQKVYNSKTIRRSRTGDRGLSYKKIQSRVIKK